MTLPVFLIEGLTPDESVVGAPLHLAGPEGDHARKAMRLGVGDLLEVCDGEGLRLRCAVADLPQQGLDLVIESAQREPRPGPQVVLVQALAKQGRDEMAVEISTELGVDRIVPWQANRSIVRWAGPKAIKSAQKWEHLIRAAAKQSRRAFVPTLADPAGSAEVARMIKRVVGEGGAALICDEEAEIPLPDALEPASGEREPRQILVIVGPEGGIAPEERELFVDAGGRLVLLGPTVLRASTAGAAAITAINYLTGRWPSSSLDATSSLHTKAGGSPTDVS